MISKLSLFKSLECKIILLITYYIYQVQTEIFESFFLDFARITFFAIRYKLSENVKFLGKGYDFFGEPIQNITIRSQPVQLNNWNSLLGL